MNQIQEKVLRHMSEVIDNYDLEALNVESSTNIGRISIQKYKTVGELGSVKYNFQDNTVELHLYLKDKEFPTIFPDNIFYILYTDSKKYDAFIVVLKKLLTTIKKKN